MAPIRKANWDPSLMNLDLLGWDQIIAISQSSIDDVLKWNYLSNESRDVEYEEDLGDGLVLGIKGRTDFPTVELISTDLVYYVMKFKKEQATLTLTRRGTEVWSDDCGKWKLKFKASISRTKLKKAPHDVIDNLSLPKSQGVEEYAIKFVSDSAQHLEWKECDRPNLPNELSEDAAITFFEGVLKTWLYKYNKRITIGYLPVHKSDQNPNVKRIPGASFVPTSVSYHVIHNKDSKVKKPEDGKAKKSESDNALLFLEMTENRDNPKTSSNWSTTWLNKATNTMTISRRVFVERFLGSLVETLHDQAGGLARRMAARQAWDVDAAVEQQNDRTSDWRGNWDDMVKEDSEGIDRLMTKLSEGVEDSQAPPVHAPFSEMKIKDEKNGTRIMSYQSKQTHQGLIWNWGGKKKKVNVTMEISVTSVIRPQETTKVFRIEFSLEVKTKFEIPSMGYEFYTTSKPHWTYTINMLSVDRGGILGSEVTPDEPKFEAEMFCVQKKGASKERNTDKDYQDTFNDLLKKRVATGLQLIHTEVEKATKGANKFVFPGGHVFDMKDAVFTNTGNLLVKLTYRQGDNTARTIIYKDRNQPWRLDVGKRLKLGDFIYSKGRYLMWMQWDGNLVLYGDPPGRAAWHTDTANNSSGSGSQYCELLPDGNFVVGHEDGRSYRWESRSNTYGAVRPYIIVEDHNICLYDEEVEGCHWSAL